MFGPPGETPGSSPPTLHGAIAQWSHTTSVAPPPGFPARPPGCALLNDGRLTQMEARTQEDARTHAETHTSLILTPGDSSLDSSSPSEQSFESVYDVPTNASQATRNVAGCHAISSSSDTSPDSPFGAVSSPLINRNLHPGAVTPDTLIYRSPGGQVEFHRVDRSSPTLEDLQAGLTSIFGGGLSSTGHHSTPVSHSHSDRRRSLEIETSPPPAAQDPIAVEINNPIPLPVQRRSNDADPPNNRVESSPRNGQVRRNTHTWVTTEGRCPTTTSREGIHINFTFPMPDRLVCTEVDCLSEFFCKSWTDTKQSLTRHLTRDHGLPISTTSNWCTLCMQCAGKRPTRHPCFTDHPAIRITEAKSKRWSCSRCTFVASSQTALRVHRMQHRRDDIKTKAPSTSSPSTTGPPNRQKSSSSATSSSDRRPHPPPSQSPPSLRDLLTATPRSIHNEQPPSPRRLPPPSPPLALAPNPFPVPITIEPRSISTSKDLVRKPPDAARRKKTNLTNPCVSFSPLDIGPASQNIDPPNSLHQNSNQRHSADVQEHTPISVGEFLSRRKTKPAPLARRKQKREVAGNPSNVNSSDGLRTANTSRSNKQPATSPTTDHRSSAADLFGLPDLQSNYLQSASYSIHNSSPPGSPPSEPDDNTPPPESQTAGLGDDGPHQQSQDPIPDSQLTPPLTPPEIRLGDTLKILDEPLSRILANDCSEESWSLFENTLKQATSLAHEAHKIRLSHPQQKTNQPTPNPDDAQYIQRLYKRNRKRAIRVITGEESPSCSIPIAQLHDFFKEKRAAKEMDDKYFNNVTSAPEPVFMEPFTAGETINRLRRFENSAPGDDRLTYKHWAQLDPDGTVLAKIMNVCLRYQRVPAEWRKSRTILIFKKGDPESPENWRPIALCRTIAKLFTGLVASRLTSWLVQHEVLHPGQKGFLPHDGVFEQNFILQHLMKTTRLDKKRNLHLACIDFADAFGSVPHRALPLALKKHGAGDVIANIVQSLYCGATTTISTQEGQSEPIPLDAGILQGDCLSGLLFDLAIDPVLREADPVPVNLITTTSSSSSADHNPAPASAMPNATPPDQLTDPTTTHPSGALAYCDDVSMFAESHQQLQAMVDRACTSASLLSLRINTRKCTAMHLSGASPVGLRETEIKINGQNIPSLKEGEPLCFVGIPIGFMQQFADTEHIPKFIDLGRKILSSKLAPWQRIDAVKTFLFPAMTFSMRTGRHTKTQWAQVDNAIRPLLKNTLYVPPSAANEYLYGSTKAGACGIPLAAEDCDIFTVDNAFKLLTSNDHRVATIAKQSLESTTSRRLGHQASDLEKSDFLSGSNAGGFSGSSNPLSNEFTKARAASSRLGVIWRLDNGAPSLEVGETAVYQHQRRAVAKTIRALCRASKDQRLHNLPNQGKVLECVAKHKASSHFLASGQYTSFASWRFIHRARLNLVHLNAAKPWTRGNNNNRCRRCNAAPETLPHVINHCMRYSSAFKRRHNNIVARVKNALTGSSATILAEDNSLDETRLRPDLVFQKDGTTYILDVAVPFDNRPQAFEEARQRKLTKYEPMRQRLSAHGPCEVVAILVGSLGSWDTGNDATIKKICSRTYASHFRRLCVSDAIRLSRDIYAAHVSGNTLDVNWRADNINAEPEQTLQAPNDVEENTTTRP